VKKSRFTDSQIIGILKQAEAGSPVPELCRTHGISRVTFYNVLGKVQWPGRENSYRNFSFEYRPLFTSIPGQRNVASHSSLAVSRQRS
jgi:hypothetical protein